MLASSRGRATRAGQSGAGRGTETHPGCTCPCCCSCSRSSCSLARCKSPRATTADTGSWRCWWRRLAHARTPRATCTCPGTLPAAQASCLAAGGPLGRHLRIQPRNTSLALSPRPANQSSPRGRMHARGLNKLKERLQMKPGRARNTIPASILGLELHFGRNAQALDTEVVRTSEGHFIGLLRTLCTHHVSRSALAPKIEPPTLCMTCMPTVIPHNRNLGGAASWSIRESPTL